MATVRLKKAYRYNNAGEVADFAQSEAEALVASGAAEWVNAPPPGATEAPPVDRALKPDAVVKRDAPAAKPGKK